MSLALISTGKNNKWDEALKTLAPNLDLQIYPDIDRPEEVEGALVWRHPHGILNTFPKLKWISSLGAGVDHVLTDPHLPPGVPITRIVDPQLATDISRTATMGVIGFEKQMPTYIRQKRVGQWAQHPPERLKKIGVLGLGEMGSRIAHDLFRFEYEIKGFSRSKKVMEGIETFHGKTIPREFLSDIDVLINVLPLTADTENILNLELFSKMKRGAYLINLGRGRHLVESDLLNALESGQIGGAFLDVFRAEPLPESHPYWVQEKIIVTPHIASITNPFSAGELILENYRRLQRGEELRHVVDRDKGY